MNGKKQRPKRKKKTLLDFSVWQIMLGVVCGYLAVNIFMKFLENSGTTLFARVLGIWAEMAMLVIALGVGLLIYGAVSYKER